LRRIVRATRGDPERQWISDAAQFTGVSLVAYVIGGMFLNMPYFDLFYQLVAVVVILQQASQAPGTAIATVEEPLLPALWARVRGRKATVDLRPPRAGG
jgi:hypothetical protein